MSLTNARLLDPRRWITLVSTAFVLLLGACGEGPPVLNAVGSYSDIAILTDTSQFNAVAFQLEKALEVDAGTGLQPEPMFDVDVFDFSDKREAGIYKNVIVLGYQKGRDRASREIGRRLSGQPMKVMESRHLFFAVREDVYAQNQNVIFLAGVDRNYMQSAVLKEAAALRGQIEARNRERIRDYLFTRGRDVETEQRISEQAGFRIAVPTGYRLNGIKQNKDGDLGCVEILANSPTREVVVFWQDVDPDAVDLEDTEALIQLRRRWGVFIDEKLQDAYGFHWSREQFRGEERPMLSGLYETGEFAYGGPFRTVYFLDRQGRRLYGINWLCFFPDGSKHTYLREVRTIAETFSPRP